MGFRKFFGEQKTDILQLENAYDFSSRKHFALKATHTGINNRQVVQCVLAQVDQYELKTT